MNDKLSGNQSYSSGLAYALASYIAWGIFPVYWKLLKIVPAQQILAHRIIWSLVFLLAILLLTRNKTWISYLKTPKTLGILAVTGILVGGNWFVYIYAVNSNHIIDSSLGYYINPLVNILLGTIFLREKLVKLQIIAVVLAFSGVLWLTVSVGKLPWISLYLAFSFGLYGLIRKVANFQSMPGLVVETLILSPVALIYLAFVQNQGTGIFLNTGISTDILLILGGPVTALPLYWFGKAATRIPLSTIGFMQYLAPTLQLLSGVFIYHEKLSPVMLGSFVLVWAGLLVYTFHLLTQLGKKNPSRL